MPAEVATQQSSTSSSKEDWRSVGKTFIKKAISEQGIPGKPFEKLFRKPRPSPLKQGASSLAKEDSIARVKPSWRMTPSVTAHSTSRERVESRPISVLRSKVRETNDVRSIQFYLCTQPDEYSLHDMIFAILHDGSLVFWKTPGLNEQPRLEDCAHVCDSV